MQTELDLVVDTMKAKESEPIMTLKGVKQCALVSERKRMNEERNGTEGKLRTF